MTLKDAGVKPVAIVLPEELRSVTHWPLNELPERSTEFTVSDIVVVVLVTVNCAEAKPDAASLALTV